MSTKAPPPRLRTIIAILIALTSVLGAMAAWRASVASSTATGAERKGFADATTRERTRASILTNLDSVFSSYVRSRAERTRATELRERINQLPPVEASKLEAEATAYQSLAEINLGPVNADALRPDGSLDLDRAFALEWELRKGEIDVNFAEDFAEADDAQEKSEKLVGLTALLIAAAFFLTLAEVAKSVAYRFYFVGGIVVLVTATVLFAMVEFA